MRTCSLPAFVERYFGGNVTAFAGYIGMSQTTVRRWLLDFDDPDHLTPSMESVITIYVKTGGKVPPNKLFPLPVLRRRLALKPRRPSRLGRPPVNNGIVRSAAT